MKKFLKFFGLFLLVGGSFYAWYVHMNYRLEEISPNKVYKSALIAPDKLPLFLEEHKIKTIVDLLDPGVQDNLNPATIKEIDAEEAAVQKYNKEMHKNVVHVNIPSPQVPTKKTLKKFFEVMDNPESYPVLIHCYHGTGRAPLYSALYRIEYENWSNADARAKTRIVVDALGYHSSFSDGREKGDFLMHYKPRSAGKEATINQLKE